MTNELPISARSLGTLLRLKMEIEARRIRQAFAVNVTDAKTAELAKKRARKQYEVKGRIVGADIRWDVFELVPGKLPRYRLGDFHWQAEAIAHARDLVNGKVSVSFGGARTAISVGVRASGIITPSKALDMPGRSTVTVKPNGDNSFVISGGGR